MVLGFIPHRIFRSERSRQTGAAGTVSRWLGGFVAFVKTRTFALTLYVLVAMLLVAFTVANTKIVQVVDGGTSKYLYTFRTNPKDILAQFGVKLTSQDEYDFSSFKNNYATINFYQSFPVKVSADNSVKTVIMARGTVADALKKADVTLSPDDEVSVPLASAVTAGASVSVNRVTYKNVTQTSAIPYSTVTSQTASLLKNVTRIVTAGKEGQMQTVYRQKYVNGTLAQTDTVSENVVSQPVTCQVQVGTADPTPARLSPVSAITLNANGVPNSYSKLITGFATAYSPKDGHYGSTGVSMREGYVAVNPNVIPYGSKLYIVSSDGSYVYGYAVAADTGGFAYNSSGVIVDLYFNTAAKADSFGKRGVSVYILS